MVSAQTSERPVIEADARALTARTSVADAPVIHRFEHKGTEYISAAAIEEMGGPNAYARLRAENPSKKYHAFRDLNGVSADVRAAHDAAMEAGDG